MGKINRFYQPVPQQYVSQFIPENLQLMQNALNVRQGQYDQTQGKLDLYNDELLNQQALQGQDTKVLTGIRSDYDKFNSDLLGKDLSDPTVAKEVGKFIRDYKRDPRIQKLNQGLATKKSYDELTAKYKTDKEGLQYAIENDPMAKAWQTYLEKGEQEGKMAVDYIQGLDQYQSGVNIDKTMAEMTDNMSDEGRQSLRSVGAGDMQTYYQSGFKGKTPKHIQEVATSQYNRFMNTPAGAQKERKYKLDYPDATDEQIEAQIKSDLIAVGMERVGTTENITGLAGAMNSLKKKQQERSFANIQSGKTQGYFSSFDNMDDYNNEISTLKASTNPMDNRKAAQMEAQKEKLNDRFSKNLSKNEAAVINVKPEQILQDENNLNQLLRTYWMDPIGRDALMKQGIRDDSYDDYNSLSMEQKVQVFNEIKNWQEANGSSESTNLEKNVQRQYAKSLGVNYDNIEKKRNEYVAKGQIFEANDIILSSSKGSTSARSYFGDQAKTAINDVNWDIVGSTTEENIPLDQAMQTLDKQSIKVIDGINGPEVYFKYKDANGEFQDMTIQSKDIGSGIQETTLNTYNTLAGGDQQIFNGLVESHVYSNIQPVGNNSSYNQKEDVKVALGNILNSTIEKYSPDDQIEYYNGTVGAIKELDNYNDVKIVQVGNKVTLKADGKTLVEPQANVADLMDEFRHTSK